MRAGAVFHDRPQVPYFLDAAERRRVFPDKFLYLLQQRVTGDDFTFAEINQSLVQAIALCAPAVFLDQHG